MSELRLFNRFRLGCKFVRIMDLRFFMGNCCVSKYGTFLFAGRGMNRVVDRLSISIHSICSLQQLSLIKRQNCPRLLSQNICRVRFIWGVRFFTGAWLWVVFLFVCGCFLRVERIRWSSFLFAVGGVWIGLWFFGVLSFVRGEGGCVYEKNAGDFRLRRSRGRLPTLPLAQYHRRDQV